MKPLRGGALGMALLAPAACGTLAAQEQPALIAAPTPQSRAELERAVSAAFDGQPVLAVEIAVVARKHDDRLLFQPEFFEQVQ